MTEQDYELLSQYLDDELTESAAAELEQRLTKDTKLTAGLERLRLENERLKEAFNAPGLETVPARIVALLEQDTQPSIIPLPHRRLAGWGFALAASLVVAASALLITQGNPAATRQSAPLADSMLSRVLEQSPSRSSGWETLADGRQARPILSFASKAGNWCREYLVSGADGYSQGVACRSDGAWVTRVIARAQVPRTASEYRPAGSTDADQVADFIAAQAAGIALDSQQERELISRQWR